MSDLTVEKIVIAICTMIPAAIAAISSLKNGMEQKRVRKELAEVNGRISGEAVPNGKSLKKKAAFGTANPAMISNPDWYHPPELF